MQNIPLKGKQYSIYGGYVVVFPEREVYTVNGQKLGKLPTSLDLTNGLNAQSKIADALKKSDEHPKKGE